MKTNESQENQILEHLETGLSLTAYQALLKFSCFRLASRVHRLKSRGHNIVSDWMDVSNGKRVKRYYLANRDLLK